MAAPSGPAQLHWSLPATWVEQPAGGMRVGSFAVSGAQGAKADVSIIPIQGHTGGELANVNRWRGQVGLAPVAEADLSKVTENVEIGSTPAHLFDMVGEKSGPEGTRKERTVAALIERAGTTWYFKITGDDALVAAQKPAFVKFLKGIVFDAGDNLPAGHPPMAAPAEPATTPVVASPGLPAWTVPQGWVAEAPGNMIAAAYGVGPGGTGAKVTISVFPGDVGGTFANINRWRRQMGLAPITEAELPQQISKLDVPGSPAILADMKGTDARSGKPARLVAVMVPRNGSTWFYKLLGDEQTVGPEKGAFVKFVTTVRYPNDR